MRRGGPDVTVVGASVAGLFVAAKVAAEGAHVRVLERATALDPAKRTLIATDKLRGLLGPLAERSVRNEIRTFELFADGVVASVGLRHPDVIVERSALVAGLAEHAQSAGAELCLGRSFEAAGSHAEGVSVSTRDAESKRETSFSSRSLVGADGTMSRVARAAGWPEQTTVPLVQAVVRCPAGLPRDTVRVWFRPNETPYFYWLIPDDDGRGVLGLIGEDRATVRRRLDGFLREKDLVPLSYQAARIPLYTRWRPVRRGDVFLVGDAAGHVKSTTVGGLVTGFRGAAGVADAILGRRSPLLRSLRVELDLHILLRRVLHRFGERDYKRLLELMRPAQHELLSAYTRDETSRLLWRLAIREPRLTLLALRGFVSRRPEQIAEVSLERAAAQSSALT